jgi:hypothetical protein
MPLMRDQRKLFEQWVLEHAKFYRLYKNPDGSYASEATAAAWEAWQGCVVANALAHQSLPAQGGRLPLSSRLRR